MGAAAMHSSDATPLSGREYGRELTERPRATAEAALNPPRYSPRPLSEEGVQIVAADAQRTGATALVATGLLSSGAVFLANTLSPRFRGALGVSGKVALVVTPTLGAFSVSSLQTMTSAQKDPEEYMRKRAASHASSAVPSQAQQPRQTSLALWQMACNTVYNNPFKTIIGIAAPIYGGLFYKESTNAATKDMLLSQRLIHTRVYGQMVAVLSARAQPMLFLTPGLRSSLLAQGISLTRTPFPLVPKSCSQRPLP